MDPCLDKYMPVSVNYNCVQLLCSMRRSEKHWCIKYNMVSSNFIVVAAYTYGRGKGKIVARDLLCNGWNRILLQCPRGLPRTNKPKCTHGEDAGVKCLGTLVNMQQS